MTQTRARLNKIDGNAQTSLAEKVKSEAIESSDEQLYFFNGINYPSYDELVKAKRKRNADILAKSGIFEASMAMKDVVKRPATTRGLRPDKKQKEENSQTIRRSSRLAGIQSDGMYIEEERAGVHIKIGQNGHVVDGNILNQSDVIIPTKPSYFRDRVNDGSDLTVQNAVDLCESKWKSESQIETASFLNNSKFTCPYKQGVLKSSSSSMVKKIHALSVDDASCVSKLVPERIYSVAFHPSPQKLLAVAGDKAGYIGFWDVDHDSQNSDSDGVHLFKIHNMPVSNLEWNTEGTKLMSSSYDGSVRLFDVQKQIFTEIFATYDNSDEYKNKVGFGLDMGHGYWVQYVTFDPRNENCLFATTSLGDVLHIDLRNKSHISFNQNLSEKKINTARYVQLSSLLKCSIT